LLGLVWLEKKEIEPELISVWFNMNLRVHLVMGIAVLLCGIGLLLMREWGRRGMVLHALLSGLWALSFALISATWATATWDEGWERASDGGAVNTLGVAISLIGGGALVWLMLSTAVVWILTQGHTREAMNRFDRGIGKRSMDS
jgi:cell division protein FtsL